MNQLNLFDNPAKERKPPRARATDPETSHEAAKNAEESGVIGAQAQACLDFVYAYPGRTSAELGVIAQDSLGERARHIFGRRLPELERAGQVEKGERRRCRAHGTYAVTWVPK